MSDKSGVFSGVNIISFGWAIVGSLTMKYFADYGATVIKIETGTRLETHRTSPPFKDDIAGLNRSGYYNCYMSNIYSIALNMTHPRAIEVVKRLVAKADAVIENFSPGVLERWGLGYEEVKRIKPDIIMLRQSALGVSGPHARFAGFGMILTAMAGFPNFIGWPDRGPLPIGLGPYTDYISPRFASAALIAALDYRKKTGKGQLLDISQLETAIYFLIPAILDYVANGKEPSRIGNSCPFAAPHGIYPCKGDDRWCAIAVFNDDSWRSFCKAIGNDELANDPKYGTLLARKRNEGELNSLVSAWTANFTAEEVMEKMQSLGVPAGVVKNASDIYNDPQLRSRDHFWRLYHPEMGLLTHQGQGFQLSKTPARARMPSPCLGEHTEYVCRELLGMSEDGFDKCVREGTFG